MGNSSSAPYSPLELCLLDALPKSSVSLPRDTFYQLSAVQAYNADIPVTPAAVTRPSTTEEVSEVIRCAVESRSGSPYKVQSRSGGHSYGNYCLGGEDGAVVIDLEKFQDFSMDETTWYATVGAGTLLGDLTKRLHESGGRAVAHGTCPSVGIGGHATMGGLGPTSRMWGTTLDHVREVEVVLANSTITRASATLNPDIFWALKGAAASFGIITEFVLETHPEPPLAVRYSYNLALGNHSKMAGMFAAWQEMISDPNLTRKLASQVIVMEFGMLITGTYFGPKEEFDALRFEERLGQGVTTKVVVLNDWLGTVTNWAETEALKLIGGFSGPFYSKSLAFRHDTLISRDGIQALFDYFDTSSKATPLWFAIFDLEAGAVNDTPQDATAYANRDALFFLQTYAVGVGKLQDTSRNFLNGINQVVLDSMPSVTLKSYAGYVDPALEDGQKAYWGSNLPRLETLKVQIDPNDIFHNPQSVQLAT